MRSKEEIQNDIDKLQGVVANYNDMIHDLSSELDKIKEEDKKTVSIKIATLVEQAKEAIAEAAKLAQANGIPFKFTLEEEEEDQWDDSWESSSC